MFVKVFGLALILGLVVAATVLTEEEEWQNFKLANNKLYDSNQEVYRFQVFKSNLQRIKENNEKYDKGEVSYKMGINKFADMTPEEFKEIYGHGILPRHEEDDNGVNVNGKVYAL